MLTTASDLLPVNYKGKPSDLEFSVMLPSWREAHEVFARAMHRLLSPEKWHDLAGWASAHFMLVHPDGENSTRPADTGDYLRIDIPGPGPMQGHGYDWVIIEAIDDYFDASGEQEWVAMKVHPSPEPGKTGAAAHFFEADASSTFVIQRRGNKVISRYHGRNEVANTSTGRPVDNLRNAAVAAGAMLSFSEVQWSALSKALITAEETAEN